MSADTSRDIRLIEAPALCVVEQFAALTLDDGTEIRMRNLGDRVEVFGWDPTGQCRPPAVSVTRVGSHVIDVRPGGPVGP